MLLPILADELMTICQNPLYLIMAATVTSSYAFMLPGTTTPNSIVFRVSTMSLMVMLEALNTMGFGVVSTGKMKV